MHNPVAQMVTHGQVKPRKRKTLLEAAQPQSTRVKALVRCVEQRAANSDKVIVELCEEIDRLKLIIVRAHRAAQLTLKHSSDRSLAREIDAIVEEHKRKAEDTPA
jgi:L-lactate utilization protein LutC